MNVDREDHQVQISGKATGEDCDDPRAGEADGGERRKRCLSFRTVLVKGVVKVRRAALLHWTTITNAN